MPEDVLTVKALLWGAEATADLHTCILTAIGSEGTLGKAARLELHPVIQEAERALASILDISLGDILCAAWVTSGKLREAADPAHHKADEVVLVPLVEHTIRSKQQPVMDFTVNGRRMFSMKFVIELKLQLSGAILRVQASRIRGIDAGLCTASAQLSLGETKLAGRTTRDIRLPLSVRLRTGIPIPLPQRHDNRVKPPASIRADGGMVERGRAG